MIKFLPRFSCYRFAVFTIECNYAKLYVPLSIKSSSLHISHNEECLYLEKENWRISDVAIGMNIWRISRWDYLNFIQIREFIYKSFWFQISLYFSFTWVLFIYSILNIISKRFLDIVYRRILIIVIIITIAIVNIRYLIDMNRYYYMIDYIDTCLWQIYI